jgi:hypothetical protein
VSERENERVRERESERGVLGGWEVAREGFERGRGEGGERR